ncbi:IclR family transcriptional regulator [Halorubrum laminariae]|uniref:IclR family transcriptional regulator n=1 Tax=Halorubrum laminariae TaxID=1433523 RepID=A0ABD6C3L9_9EURY|nr:IclR family transcriptional regulator [Halorubrum laminariae]
MTKQGDRYHIGARFLYIGSMVRHREEIFDEIHSKIIDLAEETKERAQFMIKEHGHMVYIHQEEGENAVRTNTQLGKQMPLHATSGGKAILSELPTNRVEAIIEQHGLPEITENTITSKEEIFQEFEEIRNRGFSFNDEEYIMGLHSVSVPITKPSGIPVGAIGVSGPSHRLKGETYRSDIPDLLLGIVNEIELNMRYS